MNIEDTRVFDEEYAKGFPIILLAEDNAILRSFLLHVLRPTSFAVLVAANGQEAIELSRAFDEEITLLVTDMEMPRMGGDELAELIMRERPGIRILQMSGELMENSVGRNLAMAFLQKPFTPTVLIEKIREVMAAPAGSKRLTSSRMNAKDYRIFDEDSAKGLPVILLAEDNVVVRNLLLRVLHPISFAVLVAANGQEAIELSRALDEEITLLVTDMEMPRMGGDELGELIMRERPGIRILQMSRESVESFVGRNLGLAFLEKPFTSTVLMETIREVIAAPAGSKRLISPRDQRASKAG
jgi:CheY-like chemotaxis protein